MQSSDQKLVCEENKKYQVASQRPTRDGIKLDAFLKNEKCDRPPLFPGNGFN